MTLCTEVAWVLGAVACRRLRCRGVLLWSTAVLLGVDCRRLRSTAVFIHTPVKYWPVAEAYVQILSFPELTVT